jgi:hypothetical protein
MREIGDLKGRRFGRLIALERAESEPGGHTRWRCECLCGASKLVRASHLIAGAVRSCASCYKMFFKVGNPDAVFKRKESEDGF